MEEYVALRLEKIKSLWQINQWIKNLSPLTELIFVIIVGFGMMIYSSTRGFFIVTSTFDHAWTYKFTSQGEYSLVIYELFALLIIGYLLKVRDWSLKDFNLDFTFRLIWIGLLLMFARNLIGGISYKLFTLANVVDDATAKHVQFGLNADWLSIALIVVVNSVYEELLMVGYLFKRLEKYSPVWIIGSGLLLRTVLHTYQGYIMLFYIVPMGMVFGYYYYRYKKLWPLIIAHGMINIMAFSAMHFQKIEP